MLRRALKTPLVRQITAPLVTIDEQRRIQIRDGLTMTALKAPGKAAYAAAAYKLFTNIGMQQPEGFLDYALRLGVEPTMHGLMGAACGWVALSLPAAAAEEFLFRLWEQELDLEE